jgi:hypothetical protein
MHDNDIIKLHILLNVHISQSFFMKSPNPLFLYALLVHMNHANMQIKKVLVC